MPVSFKLQACNLKYGKWPPLHQLANRPTEVARRGPFSVHQAIVSQDKWSMPPTTTPLSQTNCAPVPKGNSCYYLATQLKRLGRFRTDQLDGAADLNWPNRFGRTRWMIEIPLRI
jgi:hypothetical protein